jgi:hypothetical protein
MPPTAESLPFVTPFHQWSFEELQALEELYRDTEDQISNEEADRMAHALACDPESRPSRPIGEANYHE